ncbi:hypothetical protein LSTR_LSTR007265, partial [Laodelphax striatellus]
DTSRGQEVLDTVYRHLNLLETSYFGLRYIDTSNQTHWLDTTKKVVKQLKGKETFTLYFGVKFYAADPCKLLEEITRIWSGSSDSRILIKARKGSNRLGLLESPPLPPPFHPYPLFKQQLSALKRNKRQQNGLLERSRAGLGNDSSKADAWLEAIIWATKSVLYICICSYAICA